jgi:hypothetical protein
MGLKVKSLKSGGKVIGMFGFTIYVQGRIEAPYVDTPKTG